MTYQICIRKAFCVAPSWRTYHGILPHEMNQFSFVAIRRTAMAHNFSNHHANDAIFIHEIVHKQLLRLCKLNVSQFIFLRLTLLAYKDETKTYLDEWK
jgi:hypothetical protein